MTDRIFPSFTWRLSVSGKTVFLTFDDGPHPDITPFVLDMLRQYRMTATFFCVGENLLRFPDITQRILTEGHRIGNHTMWHTNGRKVSSSEYLQSVDAFTKIFPATIFRPPYGRTTLAQRHALKKRFSVIMWSLLTYDYDLKANERNIVRKFENVKPGEIIVLHDNPKISARMRRILPEILETLRRNGFASEALPLNV